MVCPAVALSMALLLQLIPSLTLWPSFLELDFYAAEPSSPKTTSSRLLIVPLGFPSIHSECHLEKSTIRSGPKNHSKQGAVKINHLNNFLLCFKNAFVRTYILHSFEWNHFLSHIWGLSASILFSMSESGQKIFNQW